MKGNKLKTNTIVIMDGTNPDKVIYIANMLKEWSPIGVDDPRLDWLDVERSSMVVAKVKMYETDLVKVNERIEKHYPGLCIFNPPMAV